MHKKAYTDNPPAVVVGLSITGLGVVRSLARVGIRVIGVDSNLNQPSARTRYCEKVLCKNINNEDELLSTLILIGKKFKTKLVLFPTTDLSVLIASDYRELISKYYYFNLPSKSVVKTFMDKALFGDFAEKNGYSIPKTYIAENSSDIRQIAEKIEYPCVIKPSFRNATWDKVSSLKAFKTCSKKELNSIYNKNSSLANMFIIQELIPGPDREVYFCLLWYNSSSQPSASFVGKKTMQWIPEMGSTCIAESCFNDIVLNESKKLFSAVEYKGIGSVEFKRDLRDNVFKIIEPTVGRVDLQSPIAYHCGINIPLLEYCDCLDLKQFTFKNNEKKTFWIHEENLFWLLSNARNRYRLSDWTRIIGSRKCYALFDKLDIAPFIHFFSLRFRKFIR